MSEIVFWTTRQWLGQPLRAYRPYMTLKMAEKYQISGYPILIAETEHLKPAKMSLEEEYQWHESESVRHAQIADDLKRKLLGG